MTPTAPSPFAVRGIVEGFYGNPWTHEQRLELLGFMASRGLNTFVYTPKDDPLVRRAWRAAYEGRELRRLNELVNRSPRRGRPRCSACRPACPCATRTRGPRRAHEQVRIRRGARRAGFGLLFDDIPRDLQHEEDRAAFDTLADAHVSRREPRRGRLETAHPAHRLPDRLLRATAPRSTSPSSAPASSPGVDIFWTGRAIVLAGPRRRGRGGVRAGGSPAGDVLGQLPGQRRGDGLRAPHRPLSRPRPAPVPPRVRRGRQRHGAVRGVEDPVRDDRRLPRRARDVRRRARAGAARSATSWGTRTSKPSLLFADNVRSSCLSPEDAPAVTRALESFAFRTDQGEARGRGGGSRDARGPARSTPPTTCCAGRSRTPR